MKKPMKWKAGVKRAQDLLVGEAAASVRLDKGEMRTHYDPSELAEEERAESERARMLERIEALMKGQEALKAQTVRIRRAATDHPEQERDTLDIVIELREERDAWKAKYEEFRKRVKRHADGILAAIMREEEADKTKV